MKNNVSLKEITKERLIKKKKQKCIPKIKQRTDINIKVKRLRALSFQEAIEKRSILLSQY